jgi:hypothetical protein
MFDRSSSARRLQDKESQCVEITVKDSNDNQPFAYRIAVPSTSFENALMQIGEIHAQLAQLPKIQEDVAKLKEFQTNWQKRFGRFWPAFCFGVVFGVLGVAEFIFLLTRNWPGIGRIIRGFLGG